MGAGVADNDLSTVVTCGSSIKKKKECFTVRKKNHSFGNSFFHGDYIMYTTTEVLDIE